MNDGETEEPQVGSVTVYNHQKLLCLQYDHSWTHSYASFFLLCVYLNSVLSLYVHKYKTLWVYKWGYTFCTNVKQCVSLLEWRWLSVFNNEHSCLQCRNMDILGHCSCVPFCEMCYLSKGGKTEVWTGFWASVPAQKSHSFLVWQQHTSKLFLAQNWNMMFPDRVSSHITDRNPVILLWFNYWEMSPTII